MTVNGDNDESTLTMMIMVSSGVPGQAGEGVWYRTFLSVARPMEMKASTIARSDEGGGWVAIKRPWVQTLGVGDDDQGRRDETRDDGFR